MKTITKTFIARSTLLLIGLTIGLTAAVSAAVKPDLISKSPSGANGNGNARGHSVSADGRYIAFASTATNLVKGITDTNNAFDIFLADTQTNSVRCISLASATSTGNTHSQAPIISANGRYVVFSSLATNLVTVPDTNGNSDVFRYDVMTGEIKLVSYNSSGTAAGNAGSGGIVTGFRGYDISDDGRYVAFSSEASNITLTTDVNGLTDIYRRDLNTDSTRLVSINRFGGSTGNGTSFDPSMSGDGRYIAFSSGADDIVPGDGNGVSDIFVYDVVTQVTRCASRSVRFSGQNGSSASISATISKNGNRIAYFSAAFDLTNVPLPTNNNIRNVFVYDMGLNVTSMASINPAGNAGGDNQSGNGLQPNLWATSLSRDGRYVLFESNALNLGGNPVGALQVYRRDLLLGQTELVSRDRTNTQGGDALSYFGVKGTAMSGDGRFIAFTSTSADLINDFPGRAAGEVYVRDMVLGVNTALALNNAGTALAASGGEAAVISENGKTVVFNSFSNDLTPTTTNDLVNVYRSAVIIPQRASADFDGDGRSDFSVFRPASGSWFVLNSDASAAFVRLWGAGTDQIVPADYTGDGRTDYAVYRPSNSTWYINDSLTFDNTATPFGQVGDIPVPQDYDGDGKADLAVYRGGTWVIRNSRNNSVASIPWGLATDLPIQGDFDGDGKADLAVFRPSEGNWYVLRSTTGEFFGTHFGQNGDKPVAGDYDGDGRTDIAIFRAGTWWILGSRDGVARNEQWGLSTDIPAPGSYTADGRADVAVFRPSDGNWYMLTSENNEFFAVHFGQNGDVPVPSAFQR